MTKTYPHDENSIKNSMIMHLVAVINEYHKTSYK